MFHDMGLIGTLFCAVLNDLETYVLPPEDFLKDPGTWLRMISRYGGTVAAAPSSGYLHALRKVPAEEVRRLDLSSWRVALNGAETVDAETMRRFAAHFAPAGFREEAFLPVYGLAEASLAVTFPPVGRGAKTAWVARKELGEGLGVVIPAGTESVREIVSVGTPVDGIEVRRVAEDGSVLAEQDRVGEIQIRGSSVMRGYEANEAATAAVLHPGGWVSTGDLGFHHDGELYVVGRTKEVIIIMGRNYYASDVETLVVQLPGVTAKGVHAGGLARPEGEVLVIVVESNLSDPEERDELVSAVRLTVSGALGITPAHVLLTERGRLARTSSGKIQRHGIEDVYREHGLLPYADDETAPVEQPIATA
jgi:acyl-CoA synthetase (AMP-forming)/AMP-acid ligase II